MVDAGNMQKKEQKNVIPIHIFFFVNYFLKTIGLTNACEKLIMRLRVQAFENVLRQPVFWFDLKSSSPGNIITRLARDAPLVKSVCIAIKKYIFFLIIRSFLGSWLKSWSSNISYYNTVSCTDNCIYFWLEISHSISPRCTNNCWCCL